MAACASGRTSFLLDAVRVSTHPPRAHALTRCVAVCSLATPLHSACELTSRGGWAPMEFCHGAWNDGSKQAAMPGERRCSAMWLDGKARERRSSKPYQLLGEDPLSCDTEKAHNSSFQLRFLTSAHWIFVVFVFAAVIVGTQHLHKCVPRPLPPSEENDRFSEIRGRPILQKLSALGPKPSGSVACERDAVQTITSELEAIQKDAEGSHHTLTIEKQYPSGCFDIPRFDTDGFALCYRNVSNIIARLGRKDRPWHKSHTSVLLNCHYDSWPTSYGGSDDLVSCALMLEILRVLTDPRSKPVRHDVIFLFNGAEESSLLAAHGFITKHPYRHGIKAFINLEASGSGGRELLFQAGPGNQWLMNSYLEAAPHPHCSILGQEVFQSGVYPGDTDFRVFRDYGRIPGLDLAFVQNGYWYHTEFDKAEMITTGSMQRTGENILATLRHLLDSPYLDNPAEYGDRKFIFFDIVGLFSVVYPMKLGEALNFLCAAILFYTVFRKIRLFQKGDVIGNYSLGQFATALMSHVLCGVLIGGCVYGLAHLVNYLDMTMTWYVKQWAVVPLYGLSTLLAGLAGETIITRVFSHKSDAKFIELALHDAHMAILSTVLVVLTYKGIASAFLLMLLVIFPLMRNPAEYVLQRVFMSESAILFCAVHLLCILPGLIMTIYTTEMLISIFVPIMGRNTSNPEIIIAGFCAFSSFFICMAVASLIPRTKTRSMKTIFTLGICIWAAFFIVLNLGQMRSTYDYRPEYPSARRTQFFHMRRKFYDKDGTLETANGLVAIAQDYRGVLDIPFVAEPDSGYQKIECKTNSKFCELPYYYPTAHRITDKMIRFKPISEDLNPKYPIGVTLLKKEHEGGVIRYNFTVTGSEQISVYISPQGDYSIKSWSVFQNQDEADSDNSAFAFLHCSGENCGVWNFEIVLERRGDPNEDAKNSELLMGAVAHYLHGPDMRSDTLQQLLQKIESERADPSKWKWAMTASAWNADVISKYY
uniref:FXNA-like protease n=1 Tax=Steinernema glaseri TaxID=37863 RepID=A0A1I7Y0S5_9BILA